MAVLLLVDLLALDPVRKAKHFFTVSITPVLVFLIAGREVQAQDHTPVSC